LPILFNSTSFTPDVLISKPTSGGFLFPSNDPRSKAKGNSPQKHDFPCELPAKERV
jgi:hypothetical protein